MNPSAPAKPAQTIEQMVLVDQANALAGSVAPLGWGNLWTSLIAGWVFRDTAPQAFLWVWLVAQTSASFFNVWAARRIKSHPANARNASRRTRHTFRLTLFNGTLWGLGVLVFWPGAPFELQLLLVLLVVGLTTGVLHALHPLLPAFYAFFVPCVISLFMAAFLQGGLFYYIVALATLGYGLTSGNFAASMNRTLVDSLRRRCEVNELAVDLQLQKNLADEANVSKSRFLAAASHDLRQPVHALSLFVGALGQQPMGDEAKRLLGHVRTSVDTLSSMFNALLDISKLDARVVEPEVSSFALKPMLARICADEGALAEAKGLFLRIKIHNALTVKTDPALLERILRNLVANAVNYTPQGGVLVSARRHGLEVVLRVIDSGVGIPADRQNEVFREFVQLQNEERDRANGLGLGLAIVGRLCKLLGLQLRLRSRVGVGSVFTLRLPVALYVAPTLSPPRAAPAAAPEASVLGRNDLVLVIDDDPEILVGMQALLISWGCEVVAASGLEELLPVLAQLTAVPKVIISDYRLRGTHTGLQAIEHLRTEYNDDIPAILITGDTAPDRLREALDSGLVLMHKPVRPAALREAMARVYWRRINRRSVER